MEESPVTDAKIVSSLHQPRLREIQYIPIALNNQIVRIEGLVNSRPGVPQTRDEMRRFSLGTMPSCG